MNLYLKYFLCWLIYINITTTVKSENILVLSTVPSYSHHIWFRALVMGMAQQKNLNITMLAIEPEEKLPANVHIIHLEKVMQELDVICPSEDILSWIYKSPYEELGALNDYCGASCTGKYKRHSARFRKVETIVTTLFCRCI